MVAVPLAHCGAPCRAAGTRRDARAASRTGAVPVQGVRLACGGGAPAARTRPRTAPFLRRVGAAAASSGKPDVVAEIPGLEGSSPTPSTGTLALKGAKLVPAMLAVGLGLVLVFCVPKPPEVTAQAWQLLGIFVATIAGLVIEPLPVGAWAFLGMTTAVVTKTLTFGMACAAFQNEVIWLIVIAFFFAKGFVKTGLGDRVANLFVVWFGKSTLGLGYGLMISEAVISPAMPSTTARAGGIFLPIIQSLAKNVGSEPGPTAAKMGAFLIMVQLQACAHSSALYMTGAAQNLLTLKIAAEVSGQAMASPFLDWLKAACVPAIVCLAITPILVFKLMPPTLQQTPDAPDEARERIAKMGPMSLAEKVMLGVMGISVALWMFGDKIGVSPVTTGMLALCMLLVTGVVQWADCLAERSAWDTLMWFAILIGMSGHLNDMGLIKWLSGSIAAILKSMALEWPAVLLILNVAYFLMHYAFASQTAQVGAVLGAFVGVCVAAGAPAILTTLCFAFNTNLFGGLNHYASGQSAVYYGAGYIDLPTYFKVGLVCGVTYFALYALTGAVWWKIIGLY